jgi:hypothetical protein
MDEESLITVFEDIVGKIANDFFEVIGPIVNKKLDNVFNIEVKCVAKGKNEPFAVITWDFDLSKVTDEEIFESIGESWRQLMAMMWKTTEKIMKDLDSKKLSTYVV